MKIRSIWTPTVKKTTYNVLFWLRDVWTFVMLYMYSLWFHQLFNKFLTCITLVNGHDGLASGTCRNQSLQKWLIWSKALNFVGVSCNFVNMFKITFTLWFFSDYYCAGNYKLNTIMIFKRTNTDQNHLENVVFCRVFNLQPIDI